VEEFQKAGEGSVHFGKAGFCAWLQGKNGGEAMEENSFHLADDPGAPAMEGFLTKRAMKSGRNWKRRFFILKNNAMIYFDEKPTEKNDRIRKPKGIVEVTAKSVVRRSPVNKPFVFELLTKPQLLCVQAASEEECKEWISALALVIRALRKDNRVRKEEMRRGWLVKRAVKSQRNWRKRFFILRNGRLSYYDQPPSGPADNPKGMIEITGDTLVRESSSTFGWGKRNTFTIDNGETSMQLSALSVEERSAWVGALHLNALRKANIIREEPVKVGLFLRMHSLEKYIKVTILEAGYENFDLLRTISEDKMKELFRLGRFTLSDARSFQIAVKELRSMKPSELDRFGVTELTTLTLKRRVSSKRTSGRQSRDGWGGDNLVDKVDDYGNIKERSSKRHLSRDSSFQRRIGNALSFSSSSFLLQPQAGEVEPERRLYTWGDDSEMQLGLGSATKEFKIEPHHVHALKKKTEPRVVFAGASCMAAITHKSGTVFTWGTGPLGVSGKSHQNRPHLVDALRRAKIVSIGIGDQHMGAISSGGDLYMWGIGPNGELGLGDSRLKAKEPALLESVGTIAGSPVTAISCGPEHTLLLAEGGVLMTMGRGQHGRLGLGTEDNFYEPVLIESLAGHRMSRIATGDRFSMSVTISGQGCFWWGRIGEHQGPLVPIRMEPFDEEERPIDGLNAAGDMVAFVVGIDPLGELNENDDDLLDVVESSVYTMGGTPFLLGHGDEQVRNVPTRVMSLEGHGVIQVSCSRTHVAALCDDGRLLAWGDDSRGQLGSGYLVSVSRPLSAMRVSGYAYKWVQCGDGFTAAIGIHDDNAGLPYRSDSIAEDELSDSILPPPPPPPEELFEEEQRKEQAFALELEELKEMTKEVEDELSPMEAYEIPLPPREGPFDNISDEEDLEDVLINGKRLPKGSRVFKPGWLQHTDKKGRKYYEDLESGEVQWEEPNA